MFKRTSLAKTASGGGGHRLAEPVGNADR